MDVAEFILRNAPKYGLDPQAVIAVGKAESGLRQFAVGDNGTSFGPFQLHRGGRLPEGKGLEWAGSPEGIRYALEQMAATGARGLTGRAAIDALVRKFEIPADIEGEIRRAAGYYGEPQTMQVMSTRKSGGYPYDPLSGFTYRPLGMPGQGTHTVGNWESDNAWDYGAPAGTPVYAVSSGLIDPKLFGPLASSGRFGGNRLHLRGDDNEFFYQHLGDLAVKPGQQVNRGDLLGYVGNIPGLSPHLHFGVKVLPSGDVSLEPMLKNESPLPVSAPPAVTQNPVMQKPVPPPTILQPLSLPQPSTSSFKFSAPTPPPDFVRTLASNGAAKRFNTLIDSLATSVLR